MYKGLFRFISLCLAIAAIAILISYLVLFLSFGSGVSLVPLVLESFVKTSTVLFTMFSFISLLCVFALMMVQAEPKQPEKGSETFDDIALDEEVEKRLKQICDDIKNEAIDPAPGYIFYGPPGNGKTFAARVIANESGVSFFNYSASDIVSNVPSMTAENLRLIFKHARKHSPCIVFIDEIDSIISSEGIVGMLAGRSPEKAELLAQMDGFNSNKRVIVIGATNNPEVFKGALSRPGRFSEKIQFSLPGASELRRKILESHMKKQSLSFGEVNIDEIAEKTEGFSGAGLKDLVRAVCAGSIRCGVGITTDDFITRIGEIKSNDDGFNNGCNSVIPNLMSLLVDVNSQQFTSNRSRRDSQLSRDSD